MARLAQLAGFTMEKSYYHGRDVALTFFLSRVQYYIKYKPFLALLQKFAATPAIQDVSFYINPYDILNIALRKSHQTTP